MSWSSREPASTLESLKARRSLICVPFVTLIIKSMLWHGKDSAALFHLSGHAHLFLLCT
jgi:hypothetical protein